MCLGDTGPQWELAGVIIITLLGSVSSFVPRWGLPCPGALVRGVRIA